MHRRKDLACDVGGADIGASPADRAGVTVQQLLPSEVLDPAGAEPLGILQVHGRECASRLERPEEGIQRRGHHVHVLGEGDIDGEEEDDPQVSPPENTVQDIGGPGAQPPTGEQAAEGAADGSLGFRAVAALGHPEGVGQQRGRHESADHTHDDYCVGVSGQVEA